MSFQHSTPTVHDRYGKLVERRVKFSRHALQNVLEEWCRTKQYEIDGAEISLEVDHDEAFETAILTYRREDDDPDGPARA